MSSAALRKRSTHPPRPAVLIVDDDDDDRALMREYVALVSDAPVLCASNFSEANSYIDGGAIGMAVIDHHLGAERGLDLVRQWRARGLTLPLVLATSRPDTQLRQQAEAGGATSFLCKGVFTVDDFRNIVREAKESGFLAPDCRRP